MTTQISPSQIQQRVRQYWYVDGLTEIAFAFLCFLLALGFLADFTLAPDSPARTLVDLAGPYLILGGVFLSAQIVKWVKSRLTYPRTGYIALPPPPTWRRLAAVLVGMVVGLLAMVFLKDLPSDIARLPAFSGVVFALVFAIAGYKMGLARFFILALLGLGLAGGLAFSGWDEMLALAFFYGAFGLACLASGGVTLLNYLRQTAPPAEFSPEA